MQSFFHFFIYSSLLISFGAVSLTRVSLQLLNLPTSDKVLFNLLFFSTAATYLLARIMGMWNMPEHIKQYFWFGRNELFIRSFFALSSGICFLLFWWLPFHSQSLLVLLAIVTLFYSLPLFRKAGKWVRLRDVGLFKIFLIVFTWTLSTVALPVVHYQQSLLDPPVILLLLERAAYILAITLPFDIRDMKFDRHANLKTIPMLIGISHTLMLAQILIATSIFLATINCLFLVETPYGHTLLPLLATYLLSWWLIRQTNEQQPDHFYTGYLDGTMLVMGALVCLGG